MGFVFVILHAAAVLFSLKIKSDSERRFADFCLFCFGKIGNSEVRNHLKSLNLFLP